MTWGTSVLNQQHWHSAILPVLDPVPMIASTGVSVVVWGCVCERGCFGGKNGAFLTIGQWVYALKCQCKANPTAGDKALPMQLQSWQYLWSSHWHHLDRGLHEHLIWSVGLFYLSLQYYHVHYFSLLFFLRIHNIHKSGLYNCKHTSSLLEGKNKINFTNSVLPTTL